MHGVRGYRVPWPEPYPQLRKHLHGQAHGIAAHDLPDALYKVTEVHLVLRDHRQLRGVPAGLHETVEDRTQDSRVVSAIIHHLTNRVQDHRWCQLAHRIHPVAGADDTAASCVTYRAVDGWTRLAKCGSQS